MGPTKKGAERKDRYYYLAKRTGYRARSSFKLIQLGRDFKFLRKSAKMVVLDLCASPGSWTQVCVRHLHRDSKIIAVDMEKMEPLPGVTFIQGDITTRKCKDLIDRELTTMERRRTEVDLLLCDGAPNVGGGAAWAKDSFLQNDLVLSAFKLACLHLKKDGTFVTKVFTSQQYTSLLWVTKKLFDHVKATRPVASRTESAEQYMICKGYKSPREIDERMFEHNYVFSLTPRAQKFLENDKRKEEREMREKRGVLDAFDLIASEEEPIVLLKTHQKIVFETEEAQKYLEPQKGSIKPENLVELCEKLPLLDKKSLEKLVRWQKSLREKYLVQVKAAKDKEDAENADTLMQTQEDSGLYAKRKVMSTTRPPCSSDDDVDGTRPPRLFADGLDDIRLKLLQDSGKMSLSEQERQTLKKQAEIKKSNSLTTSPPLITSSPSPVYHWPRNLSRSGKRDLKNSLAVNGGNATTYRKKKKKIVVDVEQLHEDALMLSRWTKKSKFYSNLLKQTKPDLGVSVVGLATSSSHADYPSPGLFVVACFMLTLIGLQKFRGVQMSVWRLQEPLMQTCIV